MTNFAFTFDLNSTAIRDAVGQSEMIMTYQSRLTKALDQAGFTKHPEGSLYLTEADDGQQALMKLKAALMEHNPLFIEYLKSAHIFPVEPWSEATETLRPE